MVLARNFNKNACDQIARGEQKTGQLLQRAAVATSCCCCCHNAAIVHYPLMNKKCESVRVLVFECVCVKSHTQNLNEENAARRTKMKKRRRRLATNDSARQGTEREQGRERRRSRSRSRSRGTAAKLTRNTLLCQQWQRSQCTEEPALNPRSALLLRSNFNLHHSQHVFLFALCFLGGLEKEDKGRRGERQISGGSTDVALSALRGIFETLKLCHKMLLLLLLLPDSHVTVAVVPGLELEPRATRARASLGMEGASPWRDSA